MPAIFRLLDVDYVQWKAVTRTLLRTDFRLPLTEGSSNLGKIRGLLTMALILSFFGLGAAMVVFVLRDVLLSGTIALTFLGVMLATTLLTQHGMTLLATTDFVILGPRPVSSRTFLAIRVTNVLFHALVVTSLMAYPVVLAFVVAHGVSMSRGIAGLLAILAWATTLTLALVASYGTLLRAFGPSRVRRAFGYLHLAGGFLAYGGLLLSGRQLRGNEFVIASLPDEWWLVLIPPAWYASYLEIAVGAGNSTTVARAAISLAAWVGLVVILRSKLGLDYARRLADLPTMTDAPGAPVAVRTPLFTRDEARAVAILVVAHFRYDLRVRMGILAIVPLVIFYMFLGIEDASFDLVALAVLLFPALLTRHFASADAYHAAWIYHTTPADPARLVMAVKNISVVYFLLPFLLLVAAVFTWRSGDAGGALVHTTALGIISHIALQGSIIISPRLPFALPPDKTSGSASLLSWMVVVILGGQGALMALDRWVYLTTARTAAAIAMLALGSWLLNRVIRWRVRFLRR